jgi:hypothetical protein
MFGTSTVQGNPVGNVEKWVVAERDDVVGQHMGGIYDWKQPTFFHVRTLLPSIITSSISRIEPGDVIIRSPANQYEPPHVKCIVATAHIR